MSSKKPKFLRDPLSPVEFAFTSGGIDHWCHIDPFSAPCMRALSALTAYEELRKRTTRELDLKEVDALLAEVGKARESLSGATGKINIVKVINSLNDIEWIAKSKKARLDLIFEPDTAYKLAAVVFFDENESPLSYDQAYGAKKIERWKKDQSIEDFFLQQPLRRLIPFSDEFAPHIPNYSEVATQMIGQMSAVLSTMAYNSDLMTEQEATS